MKSVTTCFFHDTRRSLKDGTYPIKLRVTHNRKFKYYYNGYNLTIGEFEKVQAPKPRGKFKEIKTALQGFEQRAIKIIEKMPVFSFYEFERKFTESSFANDVFEAFNNTIDAYVIDGRVSTADSYKCGRNSLLSFVRKQAPSTNKGLTRQQISNKSEQQEKTPPLPFQAITVGFLKDYEKWMVSYGRSKTTIGIYLRPLRALFNAAIASGDLQPDVYPFGRGHYKIPAGQNSKNAISLEEISKIFFFETDIPNEAWARDMWMFTYICQGINLKDIARLKYKQITHDTITFIRAKTENTTRENLKPIVATNTEDSKAIIERWGNKPALPNSYVFPIFREGLTPTQELAASRDTIKKINKYIRQIASKVGIETDITTYVARHSFASILTQAGTPTKVIGELMGHSSEKTTRVYQGTLPDAARKEVASMLTAFKKK